MCNDGLVGCLAGHEAISRLAGRKTRLTYRMLSTVEIIGSVFYAADRAAANNVRQAMFVAAAGARAPLAYQTSFDGNAAIDRVMRHVLETSGHDASIHDFRRGPLGNDETAFDVGGIGIPCGSIMRAPFDAYHTDEDTPDAVDADNFEQMVDLIGRAINVFERNSVVKRKFSGLPCLSSPDLDLYLSPTMMSHVRQDVRSGGILDALSPQLAEVVARRSENLNYMMNVLPVMCEGGHTVLDIAEKVELPFELVDAYTKLWVEKELLEKTWTNPFGESA
jgi:aminopeptidase-like protein